MSKLERSEKKRLKKLAHRLKPVVHIGQKGITEAAIAAVNDALDAHELIKIRFVDLREKERKFQAVSDIERACGCEMVRQIGHILIVYRQHDNPNKRTLLVPD